MAPDNEHSMAPAQARPDAAAAVRLLAEEEEKVDVLLKDLTGKRIKATLSIARLLRHAADTEAHPSDNGSNAVVFENEDGYMIVALCESAEKRREIISAALVSSAYYPIVTDEARDAPAEREKIERETRAAARATARALASHLRNETGLLGRGLEVSVTGRRRPFDATSTDGALSTWEFGRRAAGEPEQRVAANVDEIRERIDLSRSAREHIRKAIDSIETALDRNEVTHDRLSTAFIHVCAAANLERRINEPKRDEPQTDCALHLARRMERMARRLVARLERAPAHAVFECVQGVFLYARAPNPSTELDQAEVLTDLVARGYGVDDIDTEERARWAKALIEADPDKAKRPSRTRRTAMRT